MLWLRKSKKGFTLIELMVVVAIIGVLALLGLRLYSTQQDKAKAAIVKANVGSAQVQIQTFMVDDGGSLDTNTEAVTEVGKINLQNPFTGGSAEADVAIAISDLATTVLGNEGKVGIAYSSNTFTLIGYAKDGIVIPNYVLTAER